MQTKNILNFIIRYILEAKPQHLFLEQLGVLMPVHYYACHNFLLNNYMFHKAILNIFLCLFCSFGLRL